jgi:hypothetical protein
MAKALYGSGHMLDLITVDVLLISQFKSFLFSRHQYRPWSEHDKG